MKQKTKEIQQELKRIVSQNKNRKLLPAKVEEEARDPNSPLHDSFEWDDSKAGYQYRLWQARHLIASVEMVADNRFESAPVYVSLKMDRKAGGYRPISDVLSNAELRKELLATAFGELRAMEFRYQRLSELTNVFKAARKAEKASKVKAKVA